MIIFILQPQNVEFNYLIWLVRMQDPDMQQVLDKMIQKCTF